MRKKKKEERKEEKKNNNTGADLSASTSSLGLTFNLSGLARCKRQHSKEHSRVIKRGKWSPGGEARLFEAVSSKGNLVMTSAEPCLCTPPRSEERKEKDKDRQMEEEGERERLGGERDYIIQP